MSDGADGREHQPWNTSCYRRANADLRLRATSSRWLSCLRVRETPYSASGRAHSLRGVAIDAVGLLGGALGGALVSSVLGPAIAQRRERRDLRADVLRRLAEVERARWAPVSADEFRAAVVGLRAAGLVAGVNRQALDRYIFLAAVAWRESDRTWEERGADPETGGGYIEAAFAALVRHIAEVLADHLWHPFRSRPRLQRGLKESASREQAIRDDPDSETSWRPLPT
jgi:hypothetical protein